MPDERYPSHQVFRATLPDVRILATLLRGLCLSSSNQRAVMTIMKRGLAVSVEETRTLSGRVILWPLVFEEYSYTPDDASAEVDEEEEGPWTSFSIQLNILLECLNIFGTASGAPVSFQTGPRQSWNRREDSDNEEQGNVGGRRNANGQIDSFFSRAAAKGTGMRLSYAGAGYPLVLLLAESSEGPTTTCELVTYEPDDQLNLEIDSHDIMIKCILKSSWLRDALLEIDPACETITFIGNPEGFDSTHRSASRALFRIQAVGPFGSTQMDYPNDREVLEAFECDSHASYSYRFSHIIKTLRALQSSHKTSLRIDREGVLSLQYLSTSLNPKSGTPVDSIVDFWCLSIDESTV